MKLYSETKVCHAQVLQATYERGNFTDAGSWGRGQRAQAAKPCLPSPFGPPSRPGSGRPEDLLCCFGAYGTLLFSACLSSLRCLLLSLHSFLPLSSLLPPAPCSSGPLSLLAVDSRAVLPSEKSCVTCTGTDLQLPESLTVGWKLGLCA